MGKSGAGKSSMRSIIFSNYVAKDVRRLGATIDVETSRVKFLGNLVLNLWDCGGYVVSSLTSVLCYDLCSWPCVFNASKLDGDRSPIYVDAKLTQVPFRQEAFMKEFKGPQRSYIFSDVGVLIYVFDVESRDPVQDFRDYAEILAALGEHSARAAVFCLVHKMDLVQQDFRARVFAERERYIRAHSGAFAPAVACHATTIWDESLYRAWGKIVHSLIPNLGVIRDYMEHLADAIEAEEVVLFERTTFLTVTSVQTEKGRKNPYLDRHERLSNIIKTFKHSMA